MPTLTQQIDSMTGDVLNGSHSLDEALTILGDWLNTSADTITGDERQAFRNALNEPSSNDTRSLVDSTLRLHVARLIQRREESGQQSASDPDDIDPTSDYARQRSQFETALLDTNRAIKEARIDIAIANAHNLLGDIDANRRWLSHALDRLPDLASVDLMTLAEQIPPRPVPRLNWFQRISLKLMGVSFERLAAHSLGNLTIIAQLQTNQIIILAHLTGVSLDAIHQQRLARRAYRVAAHLVMRNEGMPGEDVDHLLEIAETLVDTEPDAARSLARQAHTQCTAESASNDCLTRAQAILDA
jgi:hypothetical protein